MKKIAILALFLSHFAFGNDLVSPGLDGTIQEGADLIGGTVNTSKPNEYELIGVILQQRRFSKIADLSEDSQLTGVEVLPIKKSFLDTEAVRFSVLIHYRNSKSQTVGTATVCAQANFTSGPGPAEDGSEAIRVNKKWWVIILYRLGSCDS